MTLLAAQNAGADAPGRGISEALAAERAAAIRDLRYEVAFTIPADRREPVQGRVVIRLGLESPHRLVLDFAQPPERVRSVRVGGREVQPQFADGHLLVPATATAAGAN
jgi:aminopeptidase N